MRKNVHVAEAREVEAHPLGQIGEGGAREPVAAFADEYGVEFFAQGVKIKNVRGGVGELGRSL